MDRPAEPVSTAEGGPGEPRDLITAALADAGGELERLGRELDEIAMLEQQTKAEASRHEQRRAQAAERLGALQGRREVEPGELRDAITQLLTLNRRAALMEAQVDVLAGKQKALTRYRDHLGPLVEALRVAAEHVEAADAGSAGEEATSVPVSRAILAAQEDMRRDIARAMHDGPAQSLTNIVLQAQIVERLVTRDAEAALREARVLIEMVQRSLDATKTFIFNVRPMVLDDLGLVPTLRRVARDRGRDAQVPIDFESLGPDRRLDIEFESGLFRIIDEAVSGLLETEPSKVSVQLQWDAASFGARVEAVRTSETALALPAGEELPEPAPAPARGRGKREQGEDLPPALAAMIREQRDEEAARLAAPVRPERGLSATAWRQIEQRARALGIEATLTHDGRCVEVAAALPE